MPSNNNDKNPHGEDRFAQKLRLYDDLRVLPNNVSRANSAIIWIAAICMPSLVGLAVVKATWIPYLIWLTSLIALCSFAVWREKHAKAKQNKITGKGQTQPGISAADLRSDAGGATSE
jgi:hypothetical protein